MALRIIILIEFFFLFATEDMLGISPVKTEQLLKNEIRLYLNADSTVYSKMSFSTQFWVRNTVLNDGTVSQAGDPLHSETDFALRRTRFSVLNSFDDRVILYTQFGFNSLCATGSKPQLFFHDIWGMFRVVPGSCYVGFGLNGWNGISRLSNTSFQKTVTVDNPGFNYPNINHTDIESRQLGLFAKGTAGCVSYRLAISKPFVYNGVPAEPEAGLGYEFPSSDLEYKAYAAFHFLDKEYFATPYLDMTYLGTKRIFNIGAGFDIYPNSVAEFSEEGTRRLKDRLMAGIDCFLELPMKNKGTVSVYSVGYRYDFGRNYLRSSGTMNIWAGGSGVEGAGNNEFKIGTGSIWYTTCGYLFDDRFLKVPGRLQLFYALTEKNFEALSPVLWDHDFGMNYYAAGQKLKFTFQYSLRPFLGHESEKVDKYLGTVIFQVQLAI